MRDAGRALIAALDAGAGNQSVFDLVTSMGFPPPVADAVLARVEISCAQQAAYLDASVLRHAASLEPLPSQRVAGGNQQIARLLAERLGLRVRVDCPVRAIDWSGSVDTAGGGAPDNAVRVLTDEGTLSVDRVVVTVPLPLLRTLRLTPGMPSWKHDVWASAVVGMAAKLHVGLASPVATTAVMSVPDRFWSWTARDGDGQVQPVLNCFAGSPAALGRLRVDAGPVAWLRRVVRTRPDLTLDMTRVVLTAWPHDPWARGSYVADAVRREEDMWRPVGPIHFAGEHTAGEWSGLMEGALRSGRRAAADVLASVAR